MAKDKINIPQIRFKGFEGEWERNVLSNIVTQIKSYSLSRGVESDKPTNVKYIHYGDIHIGKARLLTSDLNLSFVDINMDYVPLKKGDLVLADASEDYIGIAECCVIDFDPKIDIVAGLHTIGIRPKIDQDPVFFYYNFKTDMFKKHCYKVGTGMKVFGITFNNLSKYDGYFPVKKEQTQIGDFFQKIDQVIELQQKAIDTAWAYKQSMLQKMFPQKGEKVPRVRFAGFSGDWEEKKVGEVTDSYSGGTPSVDNRNYYNNGNIPFIRSGEISKDKTELFITELGLENSSAKLVDKGDILYALYGATSGEVARSQIKGAINQAILAIFPHEKYDPEYLKQTLSFHKELILSVFLQGGQGNLSGTIIKDLKLLFPSYKEQTAIGNFFQKLDQQIEQQAQKLATYQQLKKAMLQRMFV